MVQALVKLSDRTNQILNVVKAKNGLRTKSEAIELMVEQYAQELLEPALRPDFVKRLRRREKERAIPVGDFRKHYSLE